MRLSRKEKKFITWLFIVFLMVGTQYSVYAFDPIVPQERLDKIVQIGTITPAQFETLDEATIKNILSRKDVESLLRKHFELLGIYGETTGGLILRTPEDWSKFGNQVSLSGTVFEKVYDYWYREKIQNQSELATGETEDIENFFEKHFSPDQENLLTDGRVLGKDIDWGTFAYERGLPMTAGILFALYQLWWKKKKEEEVPSWDSQLDNIYQEKFETNREGFGSFYNAVRSDPRVYQYNDWYPNAWTFWQKARQKYEDNIRFTQKAKELVQTVSDYIYNRKTKQEQEFQKAFQEILSELNIEEIEALSHNEFVPEPLPEFLDTQTVAEALKISQEKLVNGWDQFKDQFLEEKELKNFLQTQLGPLGEELVNHPAEREQLIITVKNVWEEQFEKEKQQEMARIYQEADQWYQENIKYAVYNYQYQNVINGKEKRIQEKLKHLETILAPQKETLNQVFDSFIVSTQQEKGLLDKKIQKITYRQELVQEVDYITPVEELFPYQEPPLIPPKEILTQTVEAFYQDYKAVVEQELEIDYWQGLLQSAQLLYNDVVEKEKALCDRDIEIANQKIGEAKAKLIELEQKVDPYKNTIVAHAEVYTEEFSKLFDELFEKIDAEYKKRIEKEQLYWEPYLKDPNYWIRTRAQQNMEVSLKRYQEEYEEAKKKLKSYRSGSFLKQVGCTAKLRKEERDDFNKKQKENRIEYSRKRQESPSKERVRQYLASLNDTENSAFFQIQKMAILHAETIQNEILSLKEIQNSPSPYDAEKTTLKEKLQTPNAYSFEEYLSRNGITNTSWVVKDDWLRQKENIGRKGGDYWGQKYAQYSCSLMRDFSSYDQRALDTLRNLAQKAHEEKLASFAGWEKFYKTHPLQYDIEYQKLTEQLSWIATLEKERNQILQEQMDKLEETLRQSNDFLFSSAQWLAKTQEEREKDALTQNILEAEVQSMMGKDLAPLDPQTLIRHFSEVRESQKVLQQSQLKDIQERPRENPFVLNIEQLIAPIERQMLYNETPEGVAQKSQHFDELSYGYEGASQISSKDPITYQRNPNGTYTAVYRDTGEIVESGHEGITQTILPPENTVTVQESPKKSLVEQVVERIVQTSPVAVSVAGGGEFVASIPPEGFNQEEVITQAEEIIANKKIEILNIGSEESLESATKIHLRELLSIGSPLKFGLGVIDGVKSEIQGFLSLLNPLTWLEIAKVATKLHQIKQHFLLSLLTDREGLLAHLKATLPGILPAMDQSWEEIQSSIASADDRQKGAIVASLILSLIPLGKLGKASKLTSWIDDIASAINKFVPQPKLAGVTIGGKTLVLDDLVRTGGKIIDSKKIEAVIEETLRLKSGEKITSQYVLNQDEILELGEKFLGGKGNYKELGGSGTGVFRSNDGLRQFRMDESSLKGDHTPDVSHIHLEILDTSGGVTSNNHIILEQ